MPSYMFGNYINNVISVHFPGGRLGWAKAGCEMLILNVPGEKDIGYILTPAETTKDLDLTAFRKAVGTVAEQKRVRLRWVTDDNIALKDPAKTKANLLPLMLIIAMSDPLAEMLCRRSVLAIGYHGDRAGAEALLTVIEASKVVRRAVIIMTVGSLEGSWDIPDQAPEEDAPEQVLESASDKGRAISAGDIADIASLLEHSGDVNEFINRI